MARPCSICTHDRRNEIDQALLGATPVLQIAQRYGVPHSSLFRHRANHLAPRMANALARRDDVDADRLLSWAVGLYEQAVVAVMRCQADGDRMNARGFLAEARKALELVGRCGGLLDAPATVHVDARRQLAVLAQLSEDELRALAAGADTIDGEAVEVLESAA